GPLFAQDTAPVPERVERFLSARDERPLVYVALTSTKTWVVQGAIAAARRAGARVLAVSTVHELGLTEGDDLLIEPYLPSLRVMPRVALAITAGGQGSVQTAMVSGTPLLGVPLQPEQDLNLHLIERQGAGRLLPLAEVRAERMAPIVRSMLATASYRVNAERLQGLLRNVDGAGRAAELMMRLAEGGIEAV
ncbi:MAG TPA: glycosyltransferase, partial [Polyangiaceae bacterium]|nr:glycosyltransferase [Polyangiaceae bacterium]